MFLPRGLNLRTKSSWATDGDQRDFSRDDSQVLIVDGEVRGFGARGWGVWGGWLHFGAACDAARALCRKHRSFSTTPTTAATTPQTIGTTAPQLITGSVCKKTLGTSGGGLVHTTWIELGSDAARRLINNTQFTVNHWLLHVRCDALCCGGLWSIAPAAAASPSAPLLYVTHTCSLSPSLSTASLHLLHPPAARLSPPPHPPPHLQPTPTPPQPHQNETSSDRDEHRHR